ncbi:MAG: hypothetical protein RR957_06310, partial [Oscillospiraceae bacterium]
IFKLNTCFKEVDCISVCTEKCGGIPVGIAYDCACDALLVAFADCILRVRKKECENVPIVVSTNSGTWNTGILAISPWYIRTFIKDCQQYMDIMDGNWCLKKRILLPCEYMIEDMILMPSCDCERRKTKCLVWMLATKANCYSYILEVVVDAGVEVYDCNYIECSEPRDECAISRRARNDVMESVALVETALSHILNAEGEKIQKILEVTNDVDKILDVNK